MQVIVTSLDKPVRYEDIPDGEIVLQELRVWPGWETPKFHHLFSYTRSGNRVVVPVVDGKRYTFEDIQHTINDHLNLAHQVAMLYHNNGRVTWRLFPKQVLAGMAENLWPSNIKLSPGLINMFKLENAQPDKNGIMICRQVHQS